MAQGVLVTRDWAKRVDESIRRAEKAQLEKGQAIGGLFYELRPAVLASAWAQNAAGLYVATAQFVINDTVDSSFTFDVCAPTATANPGGEVQTTRFFVVWRGRWELVAGAGKPDITFTAANFVTDVNFETKTIASATGGAAASYTPNGSILLSLDGATPTSSIGIVTDIQATGGVLGVLTQQLTATFNGTPAIISSSVATSNISLLSFLGAPKSAAITNITVN